MSYQYLLHPIDFRKISIKFPGITKLFRQELIKFRNGFANAYFYKKLIRKSYCEKYNNASDHLKIMRFDVKLILILAKGKFCISFIKKSVKCLPRYNQKGLHGGSMKLKISERFKFLIGWVALIILTITAIFTCKHLRDKVEKTGFGVIKESTSESLKKLENEFEYEKSFLKLLYDSYDSNEVFSGEDFNDAQYSRAELVLTESGASVVGVEANGNVKGLTASGVRDVKNIYNGFVTDAIRKSVVNDNKTILLNGEGNGLDGLFIVIPWIEKNSTVGTAFAFFDLDRYSCIFSKTIYNDAGYSILCDDDYNVIIPHDGVNNSDITNLILKCKSDDKNVDVLYEDSASDTGFYKVAIKKDIYFVYITSLSDADYYVATIIDSESVFKNISPVTRLIVSVCSIILFLAVLYSVYSLVTHTKRKRAYNDALNYDELTGFPNKAHHKVIVQNILKKGKGNFAYATCDVSDFKYFNSQFGYEYGNTALKYIANVMSDAMMKDETVSRTSGDHFAMLLHYRDVNELTHRVQEILDRASLIPQPDDTHKPKAIFTCGIYLITNDTDVNRIRARANVARKTLKKFISNQIAFYDEADFNKDLESHELQEDLRFAIEKKELVVYLQPKYGIENEEVIGAEALVRWNHKTRGLLSPGMFIPLAEETGFIREIDFFMFESVCKKLAEWKKHGKNLITISVNFSRDHLSDDDFVPKLIKIASDYGVEPKYLEIELTESAVYDEMGKLLEVMYHIKEAGFGLSMDDFGSGYSSLHLLREMPVDVLKLDKGFLDDCHDDNVREKKVISHVISLAKDLEISVLAEGVETESQKSFLAGAKCDMIQGYYYAKPMPMDDFEKYIT